MGPRGAREGAWRALSGELPRHAVAVWFSLVPCCTGNHDPRYKSTVIEPDFPI